MLALRLEVELLTDWPARASPSLAPGEGLEEVDGELDTDPPPDVTLVIGEELLLRLCRLISFSSTDDTNLPRLPCTLHFVTSNRRDGTWANFELFFSAVVMPLFHFHVASI